MNRHLKTTGIVLRKVDFGEADRIVTLLTPDYGKIDCVAKGARRLKSKFCGRLELFYEVAITAFEGKSLARLNEVQVLKGFEMKQDMETHQVLFYLSEITHKLIQADQRVEGVYELLTETLGAVSSELSALSKNEVILHSYLTKLLTLTGFLSPWNQCATCNDKLAVEKPVWLSLTDHNVLCGDCKKTGDRMIEVPLLKWINFMQHSPLSDSLKVSVADQEHQATWNWLSSVLNTIFAKPLKSEVFLGSV